MAISRPKKSVGGRSRSKSRPRDKYKKMEEREEVSAEDQSLFTTVTTILGYAMLTVFGHIRDLAARITGRSRYYKDIIGNVDDPEMAPLVYNTETFYTRRMYDRIKDCWNRPISSKPGARIDVIERTSTDGNKSFTLHLDKTRDCLNLGSYNYLGFADDWNNTCGNQVRQGLQNWRVSCCSSGIEAGYTALHEELERYIAKFLGKEAALVYNMGYGTNTGTLETLGGEGCLIISDALNHTSIVNGCRASKAKTKPFKHNDENDLEKVLQQAIAQGQPQLSSAKVGEYVPWKKIIVVVEGIYSMEGEICRLRQIVDVAKRYKAYIYVDEAHSIGALGKTGRGVCEHTGVDTSEVDVLMGTFSKSFGGMGGYIAASKDVIDYVRANASGSLYTNSLSPTVVSQILTAFRIITGEDGTTLGREKLDKIKSNANYFRAELRRLGMSVLGEEDSPVVPMMLFHPTKIAAFSRECYARGIAAVVVGFPAVPLYGARVRFCISAGHNKEDLKKAVKQIKEVCKVLNLRYERSIFG